MKKRLWRAIEKKAITYTMLKMSRDDLVKRDGTAVRVRVCVCVRERMREITVLQFIVFAPSKRFVSRAGLKNYLK